MGVFQSVSNWLEGSYKVRATRLSDAALLQHIRLCKGTGTNESVVSDSNGLPVTIVGGGTSITATNATSTAVEASRIIKASAGTLYVLSGYNNSASDRYIQLFDSATLPANGVVPKISIYAPAGNHFGYSCQVGRQFSSGIVVCTSSTAITKTLAAAEALFDAQYV